MATHDVSRSFQAESGRRRTPRQSASMDRDESLHPFEEEERSSSLDQTYNDYEQPLTPFGGPEGQELGWESQENMRGRGPRGYSRPPERIREEVCERLTDDDFLDPSDVIVNVDGNVVFLEGTIETRAAKRRCEDLAYESAGVREVVNHLRIRSEGRASEIEIVDKNRSGAEKKVS